MSAGENGRVAVVTGATGGVGRAVAMRFAREGWRVGLLARDAEALADTERDLLALGAAGALGVPTDVADAEAVFAAATRIEAGLGPVDTWVNDAMETVFSPMSEITPDEFRRVTEVTYLGTVHGSMAALRLMRPRNRGTIVQIGSALAYRGIPLQAAYCGAKHATRGFTDSLRAELAHDGSRVRVTMVDLPAVNTPQFDWARDHEDRLPRPMGAPIQPEVVADAVMTALRGRWREYWLGRETAMTILGNTLLPGVLDRYLAKAVEGQKDSRPALPGRPDNLEAPVTDLHRTHGRFDDEAANHALLVPGEVARVGVVAIGAVAFAALGWAIGRGSARRAG